MNLPIGIILPNVTNPFYAHLLEAVEHESQAQGWRLQLVLTEKDPKKEMACIEGLKKGHCHGLIIGSQTEEIDAYAGYSLPIITFDRYLGENFPCVGADHFLGGRMAAEFFIREDCRRIGHLQGSPRFNSPVNEISFTFLSHLRTHGLYAEIRKMNLGMSQEEEDKLIMGILTEDPGVDGAFPQ
jgi:LacI family sucrose operon transcriptional repressor